MTGVLKSQLVVVGVLCRFGMPCAALPGLTGSCLQGYRSFHGCRAFVDVVGSAAGVLGAVLVAWQVRLQLLEH
jgi:hypothetical protein